MERKTPKKGGKKMKCRKCKGKGFIERKAIFYDYHFPCPFCRETGKVSFKEWVKQLFDRRVLFDE